MKITALPTQYGEYDDHEVEHVPWLLEVVLSKGEDLENALCGENDDESHVQVLEGKVPHLSLVVVVQHHSQHVEPDEKHDDHIKLLVGHNSKDDGLGLPLKQRTSVIIYACFKRPATSEWYKYSCTPHALKAQARYSLTLGLGVALTGFLFPIFFMAA